MKKGWIKLHRKLLNSLIFTNEKGLKVWIWCLCRANHKETIFFLKRQKITIKEGEFVMGSLIAKEELQMAVATIWYWLNILEREGLVEIKRTNKFSIIKIKNWSKYQGVENRLKTDGKQIENRLKQTRMNKNEKNEKENLFWAQAQIPLDGKKENAAAQAQPPLDGKKENAAAQILPDEEVKDFWNSYINVPSEIKWPKNTLAAEKGLLMKCRRWTPEMETAVRKIYKRGYTLDDIKQAIKNYCNDILERSPFSDYANHRFSLYEFLKQENGFLKYINK